VEFSLCDGATPLAEWSWADLEALPQAEVKVDIHCATRWSKLDTKWQGVMIDTLLEAAGLRAADILRVGRDDADMTRCRTPFLTLSKARTSICRTRSREMPNQAPPSFRIGSSRAFIQLRAGTPKS
jgi:hypothetical protein